MTLNAKWTAVSFFALAAMGAASMAFAGCTVTSGTVDNAEGGTGTNTDAATTGDSAVNACPGNTKQDPRAPFVNATCQKSLESECCAQLTSCFNITVQSDVDAGRGDNDCGKYSACIAKCEFKADGTKETDVDKISACQNMDCRDATSDAVIAAYDAIAKCVTDRPTSNAACQ